MKKSILKKYLIFVQFEIENVKKYLNKRIKIFKFNIFSGTQNHIIYVYIL